jgi:cell division protein FtsW (lipid II flippase)
MQPSEKIKGYAKTVCDQIKWKKAHTVISEEIENHIKDQRDAYAADGADEVTATDQAIVQMGDPVDVGMRLDRSYRPKPQWGMLALTAGLLLIGFAVRTFVMASNGSKPNYSDEVFYSAIGLMLMAAAYFADFTLLGRFPKAFYIATVILGAAIVFYNWGYGMGALLAPLGFAAALYAARNKRYLGIVLCGLAFALPAWIMLIGPTFHGFLLFAVCGLVMILLANARGFFGVKKLYGFLLILIPVALAVVILLLNFSNGDYRWGRLRAAINPSTDPTGYGFMGTRVRALLSGSAWIGPGTAPAEIHMGRLAIDSADYLLTYLIFYGGWASFIAVMVALLFFIVKGFMLCLRQKSVLGLLVSVSVMLTFTMQVAGYVTFNLGFVLLAPLSLPLLSYGGIQTVLNLVLIGVMMSVFRTGDIARNRNTGRRKESRITWSEGKLTVDFGKR